METRSQSLARRLNTIVGRRNKKAALAMFRAIVGAGDASISQLAALARQKVQLGASLTQREWKALELMIRLSRPSLLIRSGAPDPLPSGDGAHVFHGWEPFRKAVQPYIRSIGLILCGSEGPIAGRGFGTGFLAAPDVLVTNAHVLDDLLERTTTLDAVVRFRVEAGEYAREQVIRIQKVIRKSPADKADLAALKLSRALKAVPPPIENGRLETGVQVVAVGHPFPDECRNPEFVPLVFGDTLYLKHASPGEVVPMRANAAGGLFDHDCSTLGGNSGSPVFSLATAKVVGLHRRGIYLERNIGIGAAPLLDFLAGCKL